MIKTSNDLIHTVMFCTAEKLDHLRPDVPCVYEKKRNTTFYSSENTQSETHDDTHAFLT